MVGDGEAETGPLATSWHAAKFIDPARDGVVLPILALNEYKIANPTILARIPEPELLELMRGYGYDPHIVSGDDPGPVHQAFAETLETCLDTIAAIQERARTATEPPGPDDSGPAWPMIIMRTPKGWTCPPEVDGQRVEGTFRAHQVPLPGARTDGTHRAVLEQWMKTYRPEELFDEHGRPVQELLEAAAAGDPPDERQPRRQRRAPSCATCSCPTGARTASRSRAPGRSRTRPPGCSAPGCATSRRPTRRASSPWPRTSWPATGLQDILDVTGRKWEIEVGRDDERLDRAGRVVEVLSEHICEGLLEGYLLSGRHGAFTCYEAFIHIVDSMFNQHAKWLQASAEVPWRRPIASLNYLLSSHVWRQDHNGFTHQDPGFLDVVLNKDPSIVRIYLPPDANTLLSTFDHCLRSRHYVNVVVAGKQPQFDYLSVEDAAVHCARGAGIWEWASNSDEVGTLPDVVLGAAGEIPTLEVLAAAAILRERLPDLRVRVVNVVDLMRLLPEDEHPHGLPDREFDTLFTPSQPVIFAFHGYPWLVHRLTYRRTNHSQFHVRGYKERGTTTTPFDMVMLNDLDRFHLVMDVIDRVPALGARCAGLRQEMVDARLRARSYTREHGIDDPAVSSWTWPS